jgi:hypothetical protein
MKLYKKHQKSILNYLFRCKNLRKSSGKTEGSKKKKPPGHSKNKETMRNSDINVKNQNGIISDISKNIHMVTNYCAMQSEVIQLYHAKPKNTAALPR